MSEDNMLTRVTLIGKAKDQNDDRAWAEFTAYYRKYIYNLVRRIGLNHHDADEVVQITLVKIWNAIPEFQYKPEKGRFRSWICCIAGNAAKKRELCPGNGTQAGLGVGNGHAHKDLENKRGDLIAVAALKWDIRLIKITDAQDDVTGFCHMQRTGAGIFGMVLIVAVHGDDAQRIRSVFQHPAEGGLQGSALAAVDFMLEDGHAFDGGHLVKDGLILLAAAVIDDDSPGEAAFTQLADISWQTVIRLQGGDEDHCGSRGVFHIWSLSFRTPEESGVNETERLFCCGTGHEPRNIPTYIIQQNNAGSNDFPALCV